MKDLCIGEVITKEEAKEQMSNNEKWLNSLFSDLVSRVGFSYILDNIKLVINKKVAI